MFTRSQTAAGTISSAPPQNDRRWLMLIVLLLGQFMALLDVSIVNVAMPTIGRDLDASGASLQLVVAGYTVAYAMLLITGARLGAMFGRRTMYLWGTIGFTGSSLVCGLAPNTTTLVVFRFVQGAAAALLVPQILSVIQMRFEGKERARALSGYASVLALGSVLGMVLGGVIVNADIAGYTWRPIFFLNVPIGLLVVAMVPRLVPADAPRGGAKLDLAGLSIAVPAVFLVVLPLVLGHEESWPAWTFVCMAVGVLLAAVFVPVEQRVAARGGAPLMRLDVLRSPGLGAAMLTLTGSMIPYGGFLFVFALHMQYGLHFSALRAGLTFVPMSVVFGLVGFYWRRLPSSFQPLLGPVSLALCAVSYVGLGVAMHDGARNNVLLWVVLSVLGAGLGGGLSPLVAQSLSGVQPANAPDASGLVTTTMQLGQVIGVAAYGTLFLSKVGTYSPHDSGHSLAVSSFWMAAFALVGVVAGCFLTRSLLRARRAAAVAAAQRAATAAA
jgi:MFS family permease